MSSICQLRAHPRTCAQRAEQLRTTRYTAASRHGHPPLSGCDLSPTAQTDLMSVQVSAQASSHTSATTQRSHWQYYPTQHTMFHQYITQPHTQQRTLGWHALTTNAPQNHSLACSDCPGLQHQQHSTHAPTNMTHITQLRPLPHTRKPSSCHTHPPLQKQQHTQPAGHPSCSSQALTPGPVPASAGHVLLVLTAHTVTCD
jgi:hypothetical protein